MTRPGRVALVAFCVLVAAFFILPILIVIPLSFSGVSGSQFPPPSYSLEWYKNFFINPSWTSALSTSVKVVIPVVILSTTIGTAAAFGIVRGRFPGRALVNALIMAPMIVPYVVTGLGMYAVFLGLGFAGTIPGLVLAHTALALPFVVVMVASVLSTFDRRLELAAMNLGAGPVKTFFRITLPIILPGVLAGALFAFATSWDEVVVAIFLSSGTTYTLPVQIWSGIRFAIDPTIAAVSTLLITFTTAVLIGAAIAGRSREKRSVRV
jgi:putative spermidine/putrescine transport system permease protein